jgi:hypothetical protein
LAQLEPNGRARQKVGRNGVIGGYFTSLAGKSDGSVVAIARQARRIKKKGFRARLIRIAPDGSVDRSFGRHGRTFVTLGFSVGNEANSLAIDSRGRILIGGTLVTRKGPLMVLFRVRSDGGQEMNFGPNGRVVTQYSNLEKYGSQPSALFFDSRRRLVTVHRYWTRAGTGLVLARYVLRN